jgi:DsbC/DsbD-like thiol-disulfide interchange protein
MTLRSSDPQVRVSLVAMDRSVQPGQSVTVALKLDHRPHWHTYWINAGSGYPTSVRWELPPGWAAGPIQWPTPLLIKDDHGDVSGNGYTGVLYLPVVLTAPKGDTVSGGATLKAIAKWLMCGDVCIPSQAELCLSLPVSAQIPEPDLMARAELAKMSMPQALPRDWKIVAVRKPDHVVLRVSTGQALGSPHFFNEDGFIQYDGEQPSSMADGPLSLTLPIAEDADSTTQNLVGVLAYTDRDGAYRGVAVQTPLAAVLDAQLK